jgi:hypothetical protein
MWVLRALLRLDVIREIRVLKEKGLPEVAARVGVNPFLCEA